MSERVSVVMPARDVARFVEEAVATLEAQTYRAIELVAVDDGSTDGTGRILDRLSQKWRSDGRSMVVLHQERAGAAAARNAGLARASGAFICLFDADDRLAPTLLERLTRVLRAEPDAVLAAPLWRYIDDAGLPLGVVSDPAGLRHDASSLVVRGPLHSATGVVVKADAARETGAFDTSLKGCIDLDWFVRLTAGRGDTVVIVPEPLADYRKRSGQITGDWRRMQTSWERVLTKMAEAGYGLTPDEERRARARNGIYWATIAYQAGDYAAARRLVAGSWRHDPGAVWADRLARLRTLAAMASLLPQPLHAALRQRARSGT